MQQINTNTYQIEEDEIDLKELFLTIWKAKLFIAIFVAFATFIAILFALSKPNTYKVKTILAPQEQSKSLGGLGALASMAGIGLGGGSGVTPDIAFNNLLNDYTFMTHFIKKYAIDKKLLDENFDENFIFAMNNRTIYDFKNPKQEKQNQENINFFKNIYLPIKGMIAISADKKTGLITVSVENANREFAYFLLNHFLRATTDYLVQRNLDDLNIKIQKYQKELQITNNLELKAELAKLVSNLIKQKIYTNSSKYYKVKVMNDPYIPDVADKAGPKRALIVIVSFVTSFILAIFLIFFIEFIRGNKE